MTTDTDTTEMARRTARQLRETADRCLAAADALDPRDPTDAFPTAEVAALNLLRGLDAEPSSCTWKVQVGDQECLLGWTSYPIADRNWHLWWPDADADDDRHGRSVYGTSAAEALDLGVAAIAAQVSS